MSQTAIEEIVARLQVELDRAREELADVSDEAAHPPEAELGGGSEGYATWQTSVVLRQHIEKRIEELEDALGRAERGLYGVCEDCGQPIGIDRLEVLPFTVFCIDCAPKHHHY
jgi:RNA polymerase-binding transcription factor DksA